MLQAVTLPNPRRLLWAVCALGATVGGLFFICGIRAADDPPGEKAEMIVVGPFNVGDWFAESQRDFGGFLQVGVPESKEIRKALNECQAYLIDSHITKGGKTRRFGEPRLVITGKLYHVWESKKGKFSLQITAVNAAANHTDYVASPAIRSVTVNVVVRTVSTGGLLETTTAGGFGPLRDVTYNIKGEVQRAPP